MIKRIISVTVLVILVFVLMAACKSNKDPQQSAVNTTVSDIEESIVESSNEKIYEEIPMGEMFEDMLVEELQEQSDFEMETTNKKSKQIDINEETPVQTEVNPITKEIIATGGDGNYGSEIFDLEE